MDHFEKQMLLSQYIYTSTYVWDILATLNVATEQKNLIAKFCQENIALWLLLEYSTCILKDCNIGVGSEELQAVGWRSDVSDISQSEVTGDMEDRRLVIYNYEGKYSKNGFFLLMLPIPLGGMISRVLLCFPYLLCSDSGN